MLSLLWPVASSAQLPLQAPQAQQEPPEPTWKPPSLVELPAEWWNEFDTISTDVARQRFDMFLRNIEERIQGLDAENLVAAQNAKRNLENLINLFQVARRAGVDVEFDPVLTQSAYDLDSILVLQSQMREAQNERAQLLLQITQNERQQSLLLQQRQILARQYQEAAEELAIPTGTV